MDRHSLRPAQLALFLLAACVAVPLIAQGKTVPSAAAAAAPAAVDQAASQRLEEENRTLRYERDMERIHSDLIDRQTSWFEILVSALMGGFSLVVTGLVVYITVRFGRAAVQEARQAIAAEIAAEKNAITKLLAEAKDAVAEIHADRETAHQLLANMSLADLPKDAATRATLRDLAGAAQRKPRAERTADDYRALINVAAIDEDWVAMERHATAMAYLFEDDPEALSYALLAKGFALGQLERPLDELAAYDAVLARFGDSALPALQEQVAMALVNKGVTLGKLDRPEDELAAYDDVLARFGDSALPALQERVAMALVNKGSTLGQLDRPEDALAAFDDVLARFSDSPLPALQDCVASALFNKACCFGKMTKVAECIEALTQWRDHLDRFDCDKIVGDTDFDGVRADPQFVAFLADNGCAPPPKAPRARRPR